MVWSFARINNRLAEIFYQKNGKRMEISGHTYVEAAEYISRQEKKWIAEDTKRFQLLYRNGSYKFKKGHEIPGVHLVIEDMTVYDTSDFEEISW